MSFIRSKPLVNTLCLILQPLFLNVLSIPAMAYIIRTLGPTAYGQWTSATALVATTSFLTNLGLRMLFVRSLAQEPDAAESALAEQLGLRALLGVLAAGVSLLLCAALRFPAIVLTCAAVVAGGAILTCVASAFADLLQARQQLAHLAAINLASGVALTGASVVAMWRQTGPIGLAEAYMVGPVLALVAGWIVVRLSGCRVRVHWDLRRCGQLLWESRIMASQLAVGTVANQMDVFLVPKLVGIQAFGYFSGGSLLTGRLAIVPDAVYTAFYPVLARKYVEDRRGARRAAALFLLVTGVLCVGAAACATLAAGPVAWLLFPKKSIICREVIQITAWWLPLVALGGAMGYALNAAGKEREETRLAIIANVVSMAAAVVLIARFGLYGACWSWVVRGALSAVVRIPCLLRTYGFSTVRAAAGSRSVPGLAVEDLA